MFSQRSESAEFSSLVYRFSAFSVLFPKCSVPRSLCFWATKIEIINRCCYQPEIYNKVASKAEFYTKKNWTYWRNNYEIFLLLFEYYFHIVVDHADVLQCHFKVVSNLRWRTTNLTTILMPNFTFCKSFLYFNGSLLEYLDFCSSLSKSGKWSKPHKKKRFVKGRGINNCYQLSAECLLLFYV